MCGSFAKEVLIYTLDVIDIKIKFRIQKYYMKLVYDKFINHLC